MKNQVHRPHRRRRRLLARVLRILRHIGPRSSWIDIHPLEAAIPGLPEPWDGVRIAHLSDLHAGRLVPPVHLRRIIGLVNTRKPDLIVITGDHFARAGLRPEHLDALRGLKAPLGCYAVPGNHDHEFGLRRTEELLASLGVTLLKNQSVLLERGSRRLCLAGVDDFWHRPMRLDHLLADLPPEMPRIVLSHNPDYVETIPRNLRVDLVLCGHTHGGQIRLPFCPPPMVEIRHRRFTHGLVKSGACPVYVSRGLGMIGLPVRLFCAAELPVVTLRRA